jgi:exonuclease SbcC
LKLVRLELQNFKSFKQITVPNNGDVLPTGLIIIRGPNSTGKSSLFEAILWALWGPTSVGLTNDELINFTSSFCRVLLEFDIVGTRYKIDRSYDPAKGMSVVLWQYRDDAWKRIADKSQTVGRKVDEILSLDAGQALNTLLVRQGEVANIAYATPSVLRELLVKVYNIELLGQMTKQLENLEGDLSTQIRVLEEDYRAPEVIREQIADARARMSQDETELKTIMTELKKNEDLLRTLPDPKALKTIADHLDDLKLQGREQTQILKNIKKALEAAGIADADNRIINARLASLKKETEDLESEKEEANANASRIEREIGKHNGIIGDLREKVTTLEKSNYGESEERAICPTCQKPLSDDAREKLLVEYNELISMHEARINQLTKAGQVIPARIREIDKRLRAIPQAEEAVARVRDQQKEVQRISASMEKTTKKLGKILKKVDVESVENLLKIHEASDISELQTRLSGLQVALSSLKTSKLSSKKRIEREKEQVKELERKEVKMKEIGARISTIEDLREHARYVRRNLLSGFIADYVFQKRLIGIIRKATNQYVSSFTNSQYTSIDLEPTPPKGRSGPGLILKIWDERDKAMKRTSQLSFGDRTAISLGLRLGISRTMSSIRPFKDSPAMIPRVRSVLLDEPLGGLDGMRRLSVVKNLVNDESFEQIFLITHTDVSGWEGVPVIEVSKSGSSSNAVLALSPDT